MKILVLFIFMALSFFVLSQNAGWQFWVDEMMAIGSNSAAILALDDTLLAQSNTSFLKREERIEIVNVSNDLEKTRAMGIRFLERTWRTLRIENNWFTRKNEALTIAITKLFLLLFMAIGQILRLY